MREDLINRISKDILGEYETNWSVVQTKVNEYAVLLDDSMRNFYEMQMDTGPCPLFALCYHLKDDWSCFTDTEEEYKEIIKSLEASINFIFDIEIEDIGYGA